MSFSQARKIEKARGVAQVNDWGCKEGSNSMLSGQMSLKLARVALARVSEEISHIIRLGKTDFFKGTDGNDSSQVIKKNIYLRSNLIYFIIKLS